METTTQILIYSHHSKNINLYTFDVYAVNAGLKMTKTPVEI